MEDSLLKDSLLEGSPLECSICLERMKDVSYLITEPDEVGNVCTHYFCTKCIQPLVKIARGKGKDPCCPACRRNILAVTKSRVCDELIKEASLEREQRKDLQVEIVELKKEIQETKQREMDAKSEKKRLSNQIKQQNAEMQKTIQESQRWKQEMETLKDKVEEMEKLRKELHIVKAKMEEETNKWSSLMKQTNDRISLLQAQLDASNSSLLDEKKKHLELVKQIEEAQKEATSRSEEIDKWRKMYQHAVDDLQRKSKATEITKKTQTPEKMNESTLSSWFTPLSAAVSAASPLSYLFGNKSGPLVKNAADFKFLERRGSSLNSVVWKASIKTQPHKSIALKKVKTNILPQDAWREAMLLSKLEHNNILKLQGVLRDATVPGIDVVGDFLILPFVELDLEYVMSHRSAQLKESQARYIIYQLISALYYLHSAEIVHREIRPTSILLDEACNVKLGSFSSARSLYSQPLNALPVSSYSAPENAYMQDNRPADWWKAGDIWSIGCVFFEMLTGSPLFEAKEKNSLLSQVFSITECKPSTSDFVRFPILNTIEGCLSLPLATKLSISNVPKAAQELLQNMLCFDPVKRISAADILQFKYFQGAAYVSQVHRTCPLASDATDENVLNYVTEFFGSL